MIIGTGYQNSGFFHTDFFYQFKILFGCTNPARNFRELITAFHTLINGITVFFRIQKEFRCTNHTLRSAESVQIIIDCYNLLGRIRCSRLLSVTEGCIGNPDFPRHVVRHNLVIERTFRNLGIRKHVSEDIRFLDIVKNVHLLFDFQQIAFFIHIHRTVFESGIVIIFVHGFSYL